MGRVFDVEVSKADADGYYRLITLEAKDESTKLRKIVLLNFKTNKDKLIDVIYNFCDLSPEEADEKIMEIFPLLILSAEGFIIDMGSSCLVKMIAGYGYAEKEIWNDTNLSRRIEVVDNIPSGFDYNDTLWNDIGFFLYDDDKKYSLKMLKKYEMIELGDDVDEIIEKYINYIKSILVYIYDGSIKQFIYKGILIGLIETVKGSSI